MCNVYGFKDMHLCRVKMISQFKRNVMKNKCLFCLSIILLFFFSNLSAQAPSLGSVDKFVLFTTTGAVSNSGLSHITGNVGTGTGMVTGFGNVDGVMHNTNGTTATAGADLGNAVAQINAAMQTALHSVNLGTPAGETLNAGVYDIAGSTTLNGILNLDAQNNANAVFIIRVSAGTFSAGSTSEVKLLNGAKACNVFWKIEGAVSIGTRTIMKGTIIANNAAIDLLSGVLLEGRAFSTTGAVAVHDVTAAMPLGCGTPILRGPTAPMLGLTSCYGLFPYL